jgi:hypothetical protein
MATLATILSRAPMSMIWANRYAPSTFIDWTNELLEELSSRGAIIDLQKESGAVVVDKVWITKPQGSRDIRKIYSPLAMDLEYRFEIIEGRIRLLDHEINTESNPITASAFSGYTTTSITANITGQTKDSLNGFLFVVTGGTFSGRTYVISGNDESGTTTTKLNFLHTISSALDGTRVTAAAIYNPSYYVMVKYLTSFDEITSTTEEIPIPNDFERRVVSAWLRWKCEESSMALSSETAYWQIEKERAIASMLSEITKPRNKSLGRVLAGMGRGSRLQGSNPHTIAS